MNVASLLATHDPARVAVIVARTGHSRTFGELDAASDALAHGLVKAGIGRGTRVAVMMPPSIDFFTLTFALFKAAAVPVMIDPGMGIKNLGACLKEAEPAAFIGIAKAHIARRLFGWARGAITVNVGRSRFFCDHSLNSLMGRTTEVSKPTSEVGADETAAILFTSGSTGLAKGVVYTHGIFAAQVELLKTVYGIEPGEVDLCTFPLFALFGPALGMTCIVPTMNFSRPATIDAARTIAAIEKYQVTNLFGSPAVIRRLSAVSTKLPSLRRAISAGAPATLAVIERFAALLTAPAQVFTPYGATEALPVANIGSDELLTTRPLTEAGHGLCVGRPVPGVTVHVIPIDDGPVPLFTSTLPVGEVGEFVVRGPIVTTSYWQREAATKLAKMHDPATGETLHRMGDVGYFDADGRMWFCGRKSHRVGWLFTDCVEPQFNTIEGVVRTALVGVNGAPVLCVETANYDEVLPRLQARNFPGLTFVHHPSPFPMDVRHNSKIFREKLAAWAALQLNVS